MVRAHMGIDFASRDETGAVANLPFTAGFEGTVTVVPNSRYNTINVRLRDGTVVQYLHASEVQVHTGDRVTPDTVLGLTGRTGVGAVHLHVQARDSQGRSINPDTIPR